ncbi:MAG: leucine--tRNA ligase [Candidatus Nitrosocaldus sp.]
MHSYMFIDWQSIQRKWINAWDESRIFESDPIDGKPKYFITVAYPYPNSPQHIGHGRTYTLADVHARYMRMKGYNVLFPMGFHYTGTPILAMSKRIAEQDRELIETFVNLYGVKPEYIEQFKDPVNIARYFHAEIKEGMREMGYSIDWRREFTTIDLLYNRFIEWQFKRLKDKGLISQGSHPVGWCPRDQSPVSQHDTLGDVEPEFVEYLLIKFILRDGSDEIEEGLLLPAATLRAETIFGVTNIWLNPDVDYVIAVVDGERWLVSMNAAERLSYLNRHVDVERIIKGRELVGRRVIVPLLNRDVPILPARFVDPSNGTGVVMSVPAHAPYDYQALKEIKDGTERGVYYCHYDGILKKDILNGVEPIVMIESEYSKDGIPSEVVIRRYSISSQDDPRLNDATNELYTHEFYKGKISSDSRVAMNYSGMSVKDARERVREDMLKENLADTMLDLAKPVRCRCGAECVVKILRDQWFINYSDREWKRLAHQCLDSMQVLPEEIRDEFRYVIDWLRERACARRSGLGTRLPWEESWIIESLSDSVIYMAYYVIAKYARQLPTSSSMDEGFFDYVLLGIGDSSSIAESCKISKDLLEQVRQEFLYYYPVDSRHSGRDLVPNHLTFFIFNHVAIFPQELWPRQIVVNGSVLMDGKKMSKSLGNIVPLRKAIREYGSDAIRASLLISAELLQDADFTLDMLKSIREKVERLYNACMQFANVASRGESNTHPYNKMGEENREEHEHEYVYEKQEDLWLMSRLQHMVKSTTEAMDRLRVREALNNLLYIMDQDMQWYLKRARSKGRGDGDIACAILQFLNARVRMLSPFIPFICEEMWSILGGKGFVSMAEWPKVAPSMINNIVDEGESLIMNVIEDVEKIIKVTSMKPSKITIHVAGAWKWELYLRILGIVNEGVTKYGDVMRMLVKSIGSRSGSGSDHHHDDNNNDDAVAGYAKSKPEIVKRMMDSILSTPPESRLRRASIGMLDEVRVLCDAIPLLEKEYNCKVEVMVEDNSSSAKKVALPYKPAIYIT